MTFTVLCTTLLSLLESLWSQESRYLFRIILVQPIIYVLTARCLVLIKRESINLSPSLVRQSDNHSTNAANSSIKEPDGHKACKISYPFNFYGLNCFTESVKLHFKSLLPSYGREIHRRTFQYSYTKHT